MKILKSFGELATIFLLLLVISVGLLFWILNNISYAKFKSLTKNAVSFSDVVGLNLSSFSNERLVFLEEVLDGGYMSKIKSPFSTNNCDGSSSYVEVNSTKKSVTLTCDEYVLRNYTAGDKDVEIYEVGGWHDIKKNDLEEESVLYNCINLNGNTIFDEYYGDKYFLYKVNKMYGTHFLDVSSIKNVDCVVDFKIVYRSVKRVNFK